MKAIFVDGVGRQREVEIDSLYPRHWIPMPADVRSVRAGVGRADTAVPKAAEFELLNEALHDGRRVYGQVGSRLLIWRYTCATSDAMSEAAALAVREKFDRGLRDLIRSMRQPVRILLDVTEHSDRLRSSTRIVEGVGRK